jgi:flagellar biosynthetic protein FliP
LVVAAATVLLFLFVDPAAAQAAKSPLLGITVTPKAGDVDLSSALKILLALTLISLIPSVLVAMTSFTRIIIVLSMLRQALGMQETPPNMVLIGLSLFLTLFTMLPVINAVNDKAVTPYLNNKLPVQDAAKEAVGPIREFMVRYTREQDLALMVELAKAQAPKKMDDIQLVHLVPAFM